MPLAGFFRDRFSAVSTTSTSGSDLRQEQQRLQTIIPEIRPLIQRLIALATELDKRARTGAASPRKKWRH
jgi:hypothetical protein